MRKKVLTLFSLICCIVMALGVFAACNDGDGTGGDGAGDSIFNEGASLDDIITALENAESFTLKTIQRTLTEGDSGAFTAEYNTNKTAFIFTMQGTGITGEAYETTLHKQYNYRSDGMDYEILLAFLDGVYADNDAQKGIAQINGEDYYVNTYNDLSALLAELLTTNERGEIVVNVETLGDYYVDGSAYVKLNGDSIEIGFEDEYNYDTGSERVSMTHIFSGVNATTVEIPDEVRA